MKVIEGGFNKENNHSPQDVLKLIQEDVDLSEYSDIVILLGTDSSFTMAGNVPVERCNLMMDRAKSALVN